jgi:hypothetical protein
VPPGRLVSARLRETRVDMCREAPVRRSTLCVVQGGQACNLGVPILNEEMADFSGENESKSA